MSEVTVLHACLIAPNHAGARAKLVARLALGGALVVTLSIGLRTPSRTKSLRPERADQVLARVPARASARGRDLVRLELGAARTPDDLDAATRLARAYIDAARSEADPRYYGYAEASLARFTGAPVPPVQILLLRAIVRQARHDFGAALLDLDHAVSSDPAQAQAWLTRASVLLVVGRHAEARQSCARVMQLEPFFGQACTAQVDTFTGATKQARATLAELLRDTKRARDRSWLLSLLGEIDYWHGSASDAEARLTEALRLDPEDRYTRGVQADLLIDQGRAQEVSALLSGHTLDDGLMLRGALAAQASASPGAKRELTTIEARLAENRLRGDRAHQREEARLALALGRPREALARALENFRKQQELWDVRLVLESALLAEDRQAAEPALTWLERTGCEAALLQTLARQLRTLP